MTKQPHQCMIGFVGGPSTGKTTLARAVANALGLQRHSVEFVPEYARNYIQRFGPIESVWEQLVIFDNQARREDDAIGTGADFVIAETPTFTGYAYGRMMTDSSPKETKVLHMLHRWTMQRLLMYDHIFYVPLEIPWQTDGVRGADEAVRAEIDQRLRGVLDLWFSSYVTVHGTVEARAAQVLASIESTKDQKRTKEDA